MACPVTFARAKTSPSPLTQCDDPSLPRQAIGGRLREENESLRLASSQREAGQAAEVCYEHSLII